MKRIFALLLALMMVLSLAACGGKDDDKTPSSSNTPPSSGQQTQQPSNTPDPGTSEPEQDDSEALRQKAAEIAASFGTLDGNPIVLRVLTVDTENKKALLLTEDCAAFTPFQNEGSPEQFTWESSDMRVWLGGEFYNDSFTDAEKSIIMEVQNSNPANSETGTAGCPDTTDKVFLLSEEEALTYFETEEDMIAEFAAEGGPVQWWLRTAGEDETSFILVYDTGGIYYPGSTYTSSYGVRPAIWVNLSDEVDAADPGTTQTEDNSDVEIKGEAWPENEFTALVPKPRNGVVDAENSTEFGCTISLVMTEEEVAEYAADLISAGFEGEWNDSAKMYSGKNSEGYKVSLMYNGPTTIFSISKE